MTHSDPEATIDTQRAAPHPGRIQPQPVRRQVEDHLRRAITEGLYAPGDRLPDRLLCEQFGVSRSIVREATRLLEAEGLITVIPHRGAFVALLSIAEAQQIYEVRAALEALAGAGFAQRATQAEIDALVRIHQRMAGLNPDTDRDTLLACKKDFYDVLLRGCRNAYVDRMLGQLLNRNMQLRAMSLSAPNRLPQTLRELGVIIAAIQRRDVSAAREACAAHVHEAAKIALSVLRTLERKAALETR